MGIIPIILLLLIIIITYLWKLGPWFCAAIVDYYYFFSFLLFRLLNVVDFSLLKMNNMLTLLLNLRSGMHESILSLTFCSIHIVLWFTIHIILSSFFFFFNLFIYFWPFSFTLISSIFVLIRKLKLFISQNNTIQLYNKVSKLEFIVTV